jgi:DNA-binding transcriptional LysR family regulator
MPLHMVEADLASGALVEILVEDDPPEGHAIAMSAVYLADSPLGPAGRWFIDRLKEKAVPRVTLNASTPTRILRRASCRPQQQSRSPR